jgi:DNA primase
VVAPLTGQDGRLLAVHCRWLGGLPKMLNIGRAGGVFAPPGALQADPLVLVEGLFDSLSLLACGVPAVAVIGKWIDWLPGCAAGRAALLAFDGNKPGEAAAREYGERLEPGRWHRVRPPGATKDWNNALRKGGAGSLAGWLGRHPLLGAAARG